MFVDSNRTGMKFSSRKGDVMVTSSRKDRGVRMKDWYGIEME